MTIEPKHSARPIAEPPRRHRRAVRLVAALLVVAAPLASAGPLPAALIAGQALWNLIPPARTLDGFGSLEFTDSRFGSLLFSAAGAPSPSLQANSHVGPSTFAPFGRVGGTLMYSFVIDSSDSSDVAVEIDVSGHAAGVAGIGAGFVVKSDWALRNSSGFDLISDVVESGLVTGGSFSQSFGHTVSTTLHPNAEYVVFMRVDAQGVTSVPGSRTDAEAFIDPIFRFGPLVDQTRYTFRFSEGIGNSDPGGGTVPEPGAIGLAILALATLGLVRRRS